MSLSWVVAGRRGMAIPLVLGALIVFAIFASTLMFSSKEEYRLLQRTIYRERARYIAQAGLARATALIFQNDFENRWHKGATRSAYGYTGVFRGELGGGSYEVRAEDVMNRLTPEMTGSDAASRVARVTGLTYNRVDLFARGTYGDQSMIVYQAVVLKPEEHVYAWDETETALPSGATGTAYTNVRLR